MHLAKYIIALVSLLLPSMDSLSIQCGNLVLSPASVLFPNVQADLVYVMTVMVRNRGTTVSRVRIGPPKTSHFTLNYVPTAGLAPGMSLAADIEFMVPGDELLAGGAPPLGEFLDRIVVNNGVDSVEVQCRAQLPAPLVDFNPVLDVGDVVSNMTAVRTVALTNIGGRPAKWRLEFDAGVPLEASPSSGTLSPTPEGLEAAGGPPRPPPPPEGEEDDTPPAVVATVDLSEYRGDSSVDVQLTLTAPDKVGPFRAVGRLVVEGAVPQVLDVSARFVNQKLSLVYKNSKEPLRIADFGNTLYGETCTIEALLVNDGPVPLPYLVSSILDKPRVETMTRQIYEDLGLEPPDPPPAGEGGSVASLGSHASDPHAEAMHLLEAVAITPAEGTVAPYTSQLLTLAFTPEQPKVTKGFEKASRAAALAPAAYALDTVIESAETKQSVRVAVLGRASAQAVSVTMGGSDGVPEVPWGSEPVAADAVRFGECPVFERRDVLVTVRNRSMAALPYSFNKVANFDAKPSSGVLQPMQSVATVLTFKPGQMGKFKKRLMLTVPGKPSPTEVPIWVSGTSSTQAPEKPPLKGGLDKLPEDFKPQRVFLDPAVAAGVVAAPQPAMQPWVREKPFETIDLLRSTSWDESSLKNQPVATAHLTYSVQDLARRTQHNESYGNWLKQTRLARENKGEVAAQAKANFAANPRYKTKYSQFDKYGVPTHDAQGALLSGEEVAKLREGSDMGMYREQVVPEPKLQTSAKDEPLWLLRSVKGSGDGPDGASGGRPVLDDKRLISKKFKPQPTTVAESRECAMELTNSDQAKVECSHKAMDFGRICVGSTVARSLSFTNDLARAVVIKLGKLPAEIAKSSPASQVVPAGATAGFDVWLSSSVEELLRRTLTYTVNDKHVHKVAITAEVVPIVINLSSSELNFAFTDPNPYDLQTSCSQELTLHNPGNCDAEFYWANREPFSASPEKGTLAPGAHLKATVTWTPEAGMANRQALALQVIGGAEDQVLTCSGDMQEAKCAFSAKRLELGTLPVGLTFVTTVELKNVGANPAVCFIEDLEADTTGITVEPECALIEVGSSATVTVTVMPPAAQLFTNRVLEVNVRGSRCLKLPLVGEAIVPDVVFLDPVVPFVPPAPAAAADASPESAAAVAAGRGGSGKGKGAAPAPSAAEEAAAAAAAAAASSDLSLLDFQDVTMGRSERKEVLLVNMSPIAAALTLDFSSRPDFAATRNTSAVHPPGLAEHLAGLKATQAAKEAAEAEAFAATAAAESKSGGTRGGNRPGAGSNGNNGNNANADKNEEAEQDGRSGGQDTADVTEIHPMQARESMEQARHYSIVIGPFSTLALYLDFVPSAPMEHDFILPLKLKGEKKGTSPRNGSDSKGAASEKPSSCMTLVRSVRGLGMRPRLVMSTGCVDFKDRIVATDPSRRTPFSTELTFTNSSTTGVAWGLNDEVLKDIVGASTDGMPPTPIFFISPKAGDLAPGDSVTLRVTFSPQDANDYECRLPLFLADQADQTRPYLTLTLRGSGVYPRLDFSHQELTLQTVPLGITSRGIFTVFNMGYDELSLSHRLPVQSAVPLLVEFPDGNMLGLTVPSVTVVVSFAHEQPVSFCTALELVDSEGKTYPISVIGATDNSTLTSFSFLQAYHDRFGYYTRDGKPVQFLGKQRIAVFERDELRQKEKARRDRAAQRALEEGDKGGSSSKSRSSKGHGGAGGGAERGGKPAKEPTLAEELANVPDESVDHLAAANLLDPRLPAFLQEWLNVNVMATPLTNEFPSDFIQSNGRLALDALDIMAAKKVPGRVKRVSPNPAEATKELLAQYAAMLLFLKEKGALLNGVQPRDLLHVDDYMRARETEAEVAQVMSGVRLSATKLREEKNAWLEGHPAASLQAWTAVMLQAIRTLVLARVTPKAFETLPGMLLPTAPKKKKAGTPRGAASGGGKGGGGGGGDIDPELAKSNVFSVAEGLLLKWVAYHVNATTPSSALPKRITDFDGAWADGALVCHLLHSHSPSLVHGVTKGGSGVGAPKPNTPGPAGTVAGAKGAPLAGYVQVTAAEELRDPAVQTANWARASEGLTALQVGLALSSDLAMQKPHPAVNLLYALHLYMFLPQLVPRATVDFAATLGTTTIKRIELKNPSAKPVRYVAALQGSDDFTLPMGDITLPPKGSADFPVQLVPRFSASVEARLTLMAQRSGSVQASHMVFALRSRVDSRQPVESLTCRTPCYEATSVEFDVVNPFEEATTFDVKLVQTCLESTAGPLPVPRAAKVRHGSKKSHGAGGGDQRSEEEVLMQKMLQEPFGTKQATLYLEAGATGKLAVSVLPFLPGTFSCEIVLLSPACGELAYSCLATVDLPKPSDKLKFSIVSAANAGSSMQRLLRLPAKNLALEGCINLLLDRVSAPLRTKCRIAALKLCRPIPPEHPANNKAVAAAAAAPGPATGAAGANQEALPVEDLSPLPPLPAFYEVEADSPYFRLAHKVPMDVGGGSGGSGGGKSKGRSKGGGGDKQAKLEDVTPDSDLTAPGSLLINFNPKLPGAYPCRVLVSGAGQAGMDLRLIELDCSVSAPPIETSLDFRAPARTPITQQIPLVNRGMDEWSLTATLSGAKSFTGPKTIKVPGEAAKCTYPLTFLASAPASPENPTHEGVLVLKNPATGYESKYILRGDVDQPLAQEHITQRCNARDNIKLVLEVPSFVSAGKGSNGNVVSVETDLPFATGPETLNLAASSGGKAKSGGSGSTATTPYTLALAPSMGGTYNGSITFKHAASGQFLWYTLEVIVESPKEERSIALRATVRTVVSCAIELVNPLPTPIEFDVALSGEGVLGDARFTLGGGRSGSYELFYSPLIASKGGVGSVAFMNDQVGEFWYKLTLISDPAPPQQLPLVTAAVGTCAQVPVTIENPLGMELALSCTVDNSVNYSCVPPILNVGPYASATLQLEYRPSSLGEVEACRLIVGHAAVGNWEFDVEGRGELPGVMDELRTEATIDEPTSCLFSFRNPFQQPMECTIVLRSDEPSDDTFTLLVRQDNLMLSPLAALQIPVSFNPRSISEKRATVEVRGTTRAHASGVPLLWVFPVRGLVNAPPHPKSFRVATKAKTSCRVVLDLPLRALAGLEGPETFGFELVVPPPMRGLVDASLSVNAVAATISEASEPVQCQLIFAPMRPFSTAVQLLVTRNSGGRWPFEVQLNAQEPDPDDTIVVEAALKTTATVAFKLQNRFDAYAPFQAFFSADSSVNLAVTPHSGLLAPEAAGGTALTVSFSPTEYGRRQRGRLVVLTEDTQWSYEVMGEKPRDAKIPMHPLPKINHFPASPTGSQDRFA